MMLSISQLSLNIFFFPFFNVSFYLYLFYLKESIFKKKIVFKPYIKYFLVKINQSAKFN